MHLSNHVMPQALWALINVTIPVWPVRTGIAGAICLNAVYVMFGIFLACILDACIFLSLYKATGTVVARSVYLNAIYATIAILRTVYYM